MEDKNKTKEQLMDELAKLRRQIAELEKLDTERMGSKVQFRLLSSAVEQSTEGIAIIDLEGNLLFVNRSFAVMHDYTPKELIGKHLSMFHTQEQMPAVELANQQIRETGEFSGEIWHTRRDGTAFPTQMHNSLLRDEAGNPVGIIGTLRDITGRKRMEELLYAQQYLALSLSAVSGLDEGLSLCIETAIRVSQMDCGGVYLADRASGDFDLIFHKELPPNFVRSVSHFAADSDSARLVMAGKPVYARHQELGVPLDESELREGLRAIAIVPIHHEDRVIGCLNIASHTLDDVPVFARSALELISSQIGSAIVRLEAEEAQWESEEKYRILVENANEVILVAQDGVFKFVNPKTMEVTGYSEEELISKPFLDLIHSDDREMVAERYLKRLRGEELPNVYSFRIIDKDGNIKWVDINAVLIDWEGKPATLNFLSDITHRKHLEEELLRIEKLESVGILAGGIAHDFNNILTGILGNISLARMYTDPAKISKRLIEAEKASIRAESLTQQLLTFSRGGAPIKTISSIAGILKDSTAFALSGSNVRFEFSVPDDLWAVEADEGQISQVINNLIINADQAMPGGGTIKVQAENVTVGVEDILPLEDGEYVKISVQDQGIGMSEELLQKIFDPYVTTKQKGSGLGLATCYSIISNHDGYITAESQVGVGSTFYIHLPAAPEGILPRDREVEEKLTMGAGRILVIDDDDMIRELVSDMLENIGYEPTLAVDGAQAVEIYKKAKESGYTFDAVIVDLTIPGGMGGKEAIRELKEIDPEIKAVVSSGYSTDPIMANFREYGFSDVIAKPYKSKKLSEVLHRVMNNE